MAIRAELSADLESGPGNGLLHITGLTGGSGPLHFSLCRNQGTTPFLGTDGRWQAAETWHEAGDATDGTREITVRLGPVLIDPIVEQPTTVTYRLTITIGAAKHVPSFRVIRPLFGSGAAAPAASAITADPQREEAERRAREEEERLRLEQEAAARRRAEEEDKTRVLAEEERRRLADEARLSDEAEVNLAFEPQIDSEVPVAAGRGRWPLIAAALALLVAAGGAGAWFGCAIPGFGPARCQGTAAAPPPPIAALPQNCSGLDAAACYQAGQQALQQGKLEPARQLLQQASELGSPSGSIAVARMYDPDAWSAAASPVAKADWETAVFWYEKAAAQGDIAAKTTAGKLLCRNATMDLERSQGRAYLEQAANAGSDEAKQLLATCQ